MEFFINFLTFVLILLLTYMFFRLIFSLYSKNIINKEDIFFITSNPWEYRRYKKSIEK